MVEEQDQRILAELQKDGRAMLKEEVTPEDIAEVVAFLASPAAGFMTGAEVIADGGQSLRIG